MTTRLAGPAVALWLAASASAQPAAYPTTEFGDGESSATVRVGSLEATVSLERRPEHDPDFDTPVLTVVEDGRPVLEVAGLASGYDFPTAEASIAEIDPGNDGPEVYFASYSGGAHCCTQVVVATEVADRWVAVPVGEFDGDGRYLADLDGDGIAEIATYDNRFLYVFGCYACSAAPLAILSVRDAKVFDASAGPGYLATHREWLDQLEQSIDPAERWTAPGYLAGWVAAKIRVGEGDAAWKALAANWDFASDPGEEVCLTGEDIVECPRGDRAVLSFPDRLELFLRQTGYIR